MDTIITADALSCQKEIVKKIRDKKADYVIELKANQLILQREAEAYFFSALETPQFYPHVSEEYTRKMSVARRRRHCYYDDDYLAFVLLSIHAWALVVFIFSLFRVMLL